MRGRSPKPEIDMQKTAGRSEDLWRSLSAIAEKLSDERQCGYYERRNLTASGRNTQPLPKEFRYLMKVSGRSVPEQVSSAPRTYTSRYAAACCAVLHLYKSASLAVSASLSSPASEARDVSAPSHPFHIQPCVVGQVHLLKGLCSDFSSPC